MMHLKRNDSRWRTRRRRGAVIVLFAVMMIVVIAFMALTLDLGYICSVKTDLQVAADSGALAGTGVLLEGEKIAKSTAKQFAEKNMNNQGVHVGTKNKIEVEIGHWNVTAREFIPGGRPHDAVMVTTIASNSSLFFGDVLGNRRSGSQARAVAAYRPRDIMLVLDVSGSMLEERNDIRKIDELRDAVSFFLRYIRKAKDKDRVGFAYYSTQASMGMGLSFDLNHVENSARRVLVPNGRTNIADGMELAREEMRRNKREQASPLIVLLTDGAANTIQPGSEFNIPEAKRRVIEQAELAKREGTPIFTMALDSLTTEVDVGLMQEVADITGSESAHIIAGETSADGEAKLTEAFRRVAENRPLRLVQ